MESIAEKGSRSLDATEDLNDLLRLAHAALHRIHMDTHGNNYDEVENLSLKLHDLRQEAYFLSQNIIEDVTEMENKEYG